MSSVSAIPGQGYSAPAPFTALRLSGGFIAAGSQDGSVRVYRTSEPKVFKAIRGLGDEVSSVAFAHDTSSVIWVAAGRTIFAFNLETSKLILSVEDASATKQVLQDDDDDDENVLNEIAVNKTHLIFTCDDGRVGSLDIATYEVKFMRPQHQSVAGPLTFVPNRPREIVSGGYDCALLHMDYQLGSFISSLDLNGGTPVIDTSTVPPFIHALDTSPEGRVACGLADGRLWIGVGGVKKQGGGKVKKWDGLDKQQSRFVNAATGPVVGIAFRDESSVFASSLGGALKLISTTDNAEQAASDGDWLWTIQAATISKVNAIAYHAETKQLAVAGLANDGKGALETWSFQGELGSS